MEQIWEQLLQVLKRTSNTCQELGNLARKLREVIIAEKVEDVGEIVIQQEREFKKFRGLDQEREILVESIMNDLKLDVEEITADKLLTMVPNSYSSEFRNSIDQLKIRMAEVKRENQVNKDLFKQAQEHDFVNWLVNYLITPEVAAIYDAQGYVHQDNFYHFMP